MALDVGLKLREAREISREKAIRQATEVSGPPWDGRRGYGSKTLPPTVYPPET
jgi:hypothetical protein